MILNRPNILFLLLGVLVGHTSRANCTPIRGTLTQPENCKLYPGGQPIPIKFELSTEKGNREGLANGISSGALWVEVSFKTSDSIEVWDFDVPPVPRRSVAKHAACHRGSSEFRLKTLDGVRSSATGIHVRGAPCRETDFGERLVRQQGDHIIIEASAKLQPGIHTVHCRLMHAATGMSYTESSASIMVDASHKDVHATTFQEHLLNKHVMKGREEVHSREVRATRLSQMSFLHEDLRDPERLEEYLDPELVQAIQSGDQEMLAALLKFETPGVYSTRVFTTRFCDMLREELDHANSLNVSLTRPNTMNNYGLVLEEIGFKDWLDRFIKDILNPISAILFPDWGGGWLDSHHAFSIRYRLGEDEALARHMDLSEVTLNICLGGDFEGADLYFHGVRDHSDEDEELSVFSHKPGVAVIHVGQQYHGVHQLTKGERHNLVIWGRSSRFRSSSAEIYAESCNQEILDRIQVKVKQELVSIITDEL